MDIHVVQKEDNIYTIAEQYGVSSERLLIDNDLTAPGNLVVGQALVIVYPQKTYQVQPNDTLQSIAAANHITVMQLLRNNSFLSNRNFLREGENLVISYDTIKSITTNGFSYPFIKKETLIKTLPNLTYLTIFNYTSTEQGKVIEYSDDREIIKIAKAYGVIPLLLLTTLSPKGVDNIETAYRILLNDSYQDDNIEQTIEIMKNKGYHGINIVLNYLNKDSQVLYQHFLEKLSKHLQKEGFLFFITINYKTQINGNAINIEQIDYSSLSRYVNNINFLKLDFGTNYGPPRPISNIAYINQLIDYVTSTVSPDKISIGKPIIGYDWQLPYIPNKSTAVSINTNTVLNLAYQVNTVIQFDKLSQTPYFFYNLYNFDYTSHHIVWYIDARSLQALDNIIIDQNLTGSGVWNIMIYYSQLWTMVNATFDVIKLI